MDELEISGKRYISTRRAAREHGYHSDYMGQLIRGKKVAGQKVGRAWYIDEQSLAAYLGKELQPTQREQQVQPEQAAQKEPEPVAAPVERLIIEEPAPVVVPEPQPVVEAVVSQPVADEVPEIVEEIKEEEVQQPVAVHAQPVQEIHHAPYIEEHETRIPIHIPASAIQEIGGLRYAADDSPSIPVVVRMPQMHPQGQAHAGHVPAPRSGGKFPYVSLSVVGIIAILAATFASNFVSATIVSEQGKAATVQYAIHW